MSTTPSPFDTAEFLEPAPPAVSGQSVLLRSILFGVGGAIVGAIVYATFISVTHIQIGYLAIGVAWFVAKAMEVGSNNRGGRPYQIAAVTLTCLSVALGNSLMLWWAVRKDRPVPLSMHNLWVLGSFGVEKPFLEFQESGVGAALGLFILFIGLRAAWRMTSGVPGAARHPFAR